MSIWSRVGRILTVDDTIMDEEFALIPHDEGKGIAIDDTPPQAQPSSEEEPASQEQEAPSDEQHEETDEQQKREGKQKRIKPRKLGQTAEKATLKSTKATKTTDTKPKKQEGNKAKQGQQQQPIPKKLTEDLKKNRELVKTIFHLPTNADVIIRDFIISHQPPIKAFAVFMEGLSDKTIINTNVLEPLMMLAELPKHLVMENRIDLVKDRLLPGNQVMEYDLWEDVTKNILSGSTAVFVEGTGKALIVETKGWEHRAVGDTKTESVVRGPHDAFTENLRSNTGLVRSRLKTSRLVTEMLQVGHMAPTDVAMMYVDGVVNPNLVQEVKRRIQAIKTDFIQDSGEMEQFLEDSPIGMVPQMMATERPDRVASSLAEGFVAVFVGQSPYVLILPTMIWSLMHTAEDAYLRYPFGSFLRLIRFFAFLTALLMPGLYIAITNYHPEMIPTDLMLTIAAAREKVPFPVVMETLLMELSLELIREAGVRIPNVIGPTIGIVGALILGQAAVQAAIISPLLVIVVAVTALAAFTLPNYNFSFAIRTLRFAFIFLAAVWGFYGLTLGIMVLLMHWVNLKSFGMPMVAPVSPYFKASPDVVLRGHVYSQEIRPRSLWSKRPRKQENIIRNWDPAVQDSKEATQSSANAHSEKSSTDAGDSENGGENG